MITVVTQKETFLKYQNIILKESAMTLMDSYRELDDELDLSATIAHIENEIVWDRTILLQYKKGIELDNHLKKEDKKINTVIFSLFTAIDTAQIFSDYDLTDRQKSLLEGDHEKLYYYKLFRHYHQQHTIQKDAALTKLEPLLLDNRFCLAESIYIQNPQIAQDAMNHLYKD